MADILNQGPPFWLPPDFLSDDDDDFLIPAAHNINTLLLLHNYYSVFPAPKLPYPSHPDMESTHQMVTLAGLGPSFKSSHHLTPNGFCFPHPSPPRNPPLATSLYDDLLKLKQDISICICGRRSSISCSHQKFMFQNRQQGNRVFGYGGCSETMASRSPPPHSAWPPLSHQPPNTPPLRGGSLFLNGSHDIVKRKCAGTGVFLPRQYGNPISDCRKKPGLVSPPDQVAPVRKNPVRFESHFIQNEDAESSMAARSRKKVQLMNQKQRTEGGGSSSNELCLPHEWAY